jgi:hypothetical protein
MPQANITYDAPYNRKMVNFIEELDRKHWEKAYPAYHPNPMGYRLGTFHGEPVSEVKVGGGSHPEKYLRSGNSPAYPPFNMNSGMAVNSGGARYTGVDGAVGGTFNPFDMGYNFGYNTLGPAIFGRGSGGSTYGQRLARRTRNTLKKVGQTLAPAVPFLKDEILPIVKNVGKKALEKKLTEALGAGRKPRKPRAKKGGERSGGFDFLGAIKSIGHAVGEPIGQATEALAKAELGKAVGLGRKKPTASRTRGARAEIVKQVMREKGMKMIEASKYVKAHGLY